MMSNIVLRRFQSSIFVVTIIYGYVTSICFCVPISMP